MSHISEHKLKEEKLLFSDRKYKIDGSIKQQYNWKAEKMEWIKSKEDVKSREASSLNIENQLTNLDNNSK